ncbi:hypothetical protein JHW45_10700 [Paracoccus stylophorae]|uniref:Uncharacterized protein n=1 Tax=Paracoccus stylophorae TaxID=659350 RepID=A0ABY7SRC6_9RHOB|nr:hypothetical protein [Paracoccus stylophorae]WCR09585.1 hypothetical protein JHW45_10700 [Paracoccus stylophorae]
MFEREPATDPRQRLWQVVLLTAIEDALIGPSGEFEAHNKVRVCAEARSYLTTPSKDLSEVCALAGIDAQALVDRMRVKIAQAPTPEDLIAGTKMNRQTFSKAASDDKPKRIPFPDRQFTINGTTRTASEWCQRTGVDLQLAHNRLNRGWATDRAFLLTRQEAKQHAAAEARASYNIVMSRKSAASRKRRPSASTTTYEHDGERLTLLEWSERTGIAKQTIAKRLRSGWTFAAAITTPPIRRGHG